MKVFLDCIPCFIRQALDMSRHARPGDTAFHERMVNRVCQEVPNLQKEISPPMMAEIVHNLIVAETGIEDPYAKTKQRNLEQASRWIPRLETWVAEHSDRFEAAVRVAIAGNVIDMGANQNFDLEAELDRLEQEQEDLESLEQLRQEVGNSEEILYIGDNVEEAIFDRFLLEALAPRKVYFATRSRPILNDITEEVAYQLGLDQYATILSSGSPIPGTDLRRVTAAFRQLYDRVPVVIAKGQGNYETLSEAGRPIFFLFKVKCAMVERESGCPMGHSVVYRGGMEQTGCSTDLSDLTAVEAICE